MRNLRILLMLFTVLFYYGCGSTSHLTSEGKWEGISAEVDDIFNDESFAHAFWGAKIQSLKTGEVWYERNSNKMFMPASNEKILTASTALRVLGPEFKFTTKLLSDAEIDGAVLKGDLIVWGNGDPTFYEKFYEHTTDAFTEWAKQLKAKGITKIEGDIIGDDNAFDEERIGFGWPLNGLDEWYSPEFGPLQLNENYIDFKIIPPKEGDNVEIVSNFPTDYLKIHNELTIVDTGRHRIRVTRPYGDNELYISGEIKRGGRNYYTSPTIFNPTKFFVHVLRQTLIDNDIEVTGKAIDCDEIEGWGKEEKNYNVLVEHKSVPLQEILKGLMKRSQNLYAETMPRIMSWNATGKGSFDEGKKIVEEKLSDFGIEPGTYRYMDGSGLSRYNFVSPELIVKIMVGMNNDKFAKEWKETLPIAGVDGTLKRRMKGTAAEGNAVAKTGTISNVRGLSGYVTTADGEELAFSFLVNAHLLSTKDTERITDSVLELLANYHK